MTIKQRIEQLNKRLNEMENSGRLHPDYVKTVEEWERLREMDKKPQLELWIPKKQNPYRFTEYIYKGVIQ